MDVHKGQNGRVLVIAGSLAMPGAAALTALSALRAGAGIAVVTQFKGHGVFDQYPELIRLPLLEEDCLSEAVMAKLVPEIKKAQCVVLGPGLGQSEATQGAIFWLLQHLSEMQVPHVIDADALTVLGHLLDSGGPMLLPKAILTPHPGEAASLLSVNVEDVQKNRFSAAKLIGSKTNSCVVLKGAGTIIWDTKKGFVNTSGTPLLATAGSGDVLAGMIAAFLAQGSSRLDAARLAVYHHGLSGEIAAKASKGPFIASDLMQAIPEALGASII